MINGKYQLSPNLQTVFDPESEVAMVYHTLYGNPRVINNEGLRFLDLFREAVAVEEISEICDEDPRDTIQELSEVFFLVEPGFDERRFLHEKKAQYLSQVTAGKTVDRMGLAISDVCNLGCNHCIHFQPSNKNGVSLQAYQKPVKKLSII